MRAFRDIELLRFTDEFYGVVDGFDCGVAVGFWLFAHAEIGGATWGKTNAREWFEIFALTSHFSCSGPSTIDDKDSQFFIFGKKARFGL